MSIVKTLKALKDISLHNEGKALHLKAGEVAKVSFSSESAFNALLHLNLYEEYKGKDKVEVEAKATEEKPIVKEKGKVVEPKKKA